MVEAGLCYGNTDYPTLQYNKMKLNLRTQNIVKYK